MGLPAGITKVNQFLSSNRDTLVSAAAIQIVMGNEAADLDSMASSIMYAYFKARTAGSNGNSAFVPLINVPRDDFKLRTEAVYLFREAGIDPGLMLFADEVNLDALKAKGKLKITLIDHNKLASFQEQFADCVVEILDHHKDENLFTNAKPRIIEPVGSAATLVAEALLGQGESLLEHGSAILLLGTILLDTVNLDPEAKRATPKDEQLVNRLLS